MLSFLLRNKNSIKLHILLIVVVAIVVRIFVAYYVGHNFLPTLWEYDTLAQNMLQKGEYAMEFHEYGDYYAVIPPGYSIILFSIYKCIGTNHQVVLGLQFLLAGLLGSVIYGTTWLIFRNKWIALIAGLLTVLHPSIVYYSSVNIHNFNLYVPLFHTIVFLLCLTYLYPKWKYFIILGFVGGYAVLTRGTILPFILISILIYTLFNKLLPFKIRLLQSITVFLLILLVNAPWTIRNYKVFNKVIFSQTTGWEFFWIGNNPKATGGQFRSDGTTVRDHKPVEMQLEINASNSELKDGKIFKKYALKYIQEQPKDFVMGLIRKTVLFWWFYPQTGILYPKLYLIVYKIIYSLLLLFTFIGLALCRIKKLWKPIMIFPLLLVLGINAIHAINFMGLRHRWAVEPIMLIFVSLTTYHLVHFLYNRLRQRLIKT
jgi:4-amino-4-deoxy-L-arabinose transferase-like glycosyltransferase